MTTTSSSVLGSALVSSWSRLSGPVAVGSSALLSATLGAAGHSALTAANPTTTKQLLERLPTMLAASGEQAWAALQIIQGACDEVGSSSPSELEMRSHLDEWNKALAKLLRSLLDAPRSGVSSSSLPTLAPLLCITAFSAWCSVLRRLHGSYADARRDVTNTTLPALLPLLCKMIQQADTTQWRSAASAAAAPVPSQGGVSQWGFPPPHALARSLRLLLEVLALYRHSLRFGTEKILSTVYPLLGHEESSVRALAARIVAAVALIQPATNKKDTSIGNEDEEEEAEEKKVAPVIHATQPEDPWTLCLHRTLNTFHSMMDELDEAGDALLLEQGAWKNLPRPTEAVLPLPALPSPSSSAQPLVRAQAFSLRVQGLCELLRALLEPSLFSEMHVPAAGGNPESVTVALPSSSLQSALGRLFAYELNPHQLGQITGRPMSRVAVATILPQMVQAAVGTLQAMLDLAGIHGQPLTAQVGQTVRELLARNAFSSASGDRRHALPALVPDLYALASQLLLGVQGGGAGVMRSFVLPVLQLAVDDAERLVRHKNALAQAARGANNMAAFTGAALQQPRRSQGGGKQDQADATVSLAQSLHLDQASVAAVAALEFVDSVLSQLGPMIPQQKRIQLDRSLASLAMAMQQASWKVIPSYRLAVYQCLTTSVLAPIAPSNTESSRGSSSNDSSNLLAAFSLLPYATQLFAAACQDPTPAVRVLASSSLRVCQALLHPRALPLGARGAGGAGALVQDAGLVDLMDLADSNASQGLVGGLIRGRDGSLYMAAQPREEEVEVQAAEAAAPEPISTTTPAVRVGSKRSREEEPQAIEEQATKRAHLEEEAQPAIEEEEDLPPASEEQAEDVEAPVVAAPAAAAATSTIIIDDGTDDAVPMASDDGPDEDEGAQGNLWDL